MPYFAFLYGTLSGFCKLRFIMDLQTFTKIQGQLERFKGFPGTTGITLPLDIVHELVQKYPQPLVVGESEHL